MDLPLYTVFIAHVLQLRVGTPDKNNTIFARHRTRPGTDRDRQRRMCSIFRHGFSTNTYYRVFSYDIFIPKYPNSFFHCIRRHQHRQG